jgi:hypothetical protein
MRRTLRFAIGSIAIIASVAGTIGLYLWRTLSNPLVLDAPQPIVSPEAADTMERVKPSIVEAPVTYDITAIVDSFELAVPRTYGNIETRMQAGTNTRVHFAFAISRSPFQVRITGSTVAISADVEYEARGWYRPVIGPELSAGCGTGGVPRPRVRATLVSTGRLTSDWRVRSRTRLVRLEPYSIEQRDHCRVTVFRIDITDRVIDGTRRMLEQNVAKFDSSVARWNSRAWFEQLWRSLQRPIRFTDSVYMVINPFAAQLGRIRTDGNIVIAPLRLIASPRVLTGGRPNEFELMKPIPRLEIADSVGSGAHVLMEASFSYPVASVLLRRVLVGRSVQQSGRRVRIEDVELSGVGAGRVALEVKLGGAVRGRLYFTGTPKLDRVNRQVHVPDLDYDVGSANMLLVRGFEWLKGVHIRDFLRERARLPDSAFIGKLSELAERGMNRTLSAGVELSARIQDAEGTAVHATAKDIRVRAHADADLKLAISKAPTLPRPAPGSTKKVGG